MVAKQWVVANEPVVVSEAAAAGQSPPGQLAAHLAVEVERLRAELSSVAKELEVERAHRNILQRAVLRLRSIEDEEGRPERIVSLDAEHDRRGDNIYVFDDEDDSTLAFDEFFGTPDPHLDKVRGFLLD